MGKMQKDKRSVSSVVSVTLLLALVSDTRVTTLSPRGTNLLSMLFSSPTPRSAEGLLLMEILSVYLWLIISSPVIGQYD